MSQLSEYIRVLPGAIYYLFPSVFLILNQIQKH